MRAGLCFLVAVLEGFDIQAMGVAAPTLGAELNLAKDVLGDYANHWMAIFGIALITVIVFSPTGLAGALGRLFNKRQPRAAAAQAAPAVQAVPPKPPAPAAQTAH